MAEDDDEEPKRPLLLDATGSGNRFYLIGEVDEDMQKALAEPMLKAIQKQALLRDGNIKLVIQGPGGYWDAANHILALIDIAKANDVAVETVVVGEVCSASSIIAVAGTPGRRYIFKNAEHMIHYGQGGTLATSPTESDRYAQQLKRFFAAVEKHYKTHCKIPKLHEVLQQDYLFITAPDCIKWGLADHYITKMDISL